jgi:hypothetical protein
MPDTPGKPGSLLWLSFSKPNLMSVPLRSLKINAFNVIKGQNMKIKRCGCDFNRKKTAKQFKGFPPIHLHTAYL